MTHTHQLKCKHTHSSVDVDSALCVANRTIAPYECSFPYHEFIRDEMKKTAASRTRSAVFETLHLAHIMTETNRGIIAGMNRGGKDKWKDYLLSCVDTDGMEHDVHMALRLEYQDGTRKKATQDYHGSGRPHTHALVFLDRPDLLNAPGNISASIPNAEKEPDMNSYVRASQIDRDGVTPFQVNEGETVFSGDRWQLHHSEVDNAQGVRGYFPDVLESLKCHQDVQVAEERSGVLRAYCCKYVSKFSNSFADDLLNDSASGEFVPDVAYVASVSLSCAL